MSEDKSRKTEEPTRRKLEQSRKKGQVPKSKEVTSTLMLVVAVIYFWLGWDWFLGHLQQLIERPAYLYDWEFRAAFDHMYQFALKQAFYTMIFPFVLMLFLAALIGNIMQFGIVFAVDPMIPRGDKINPVTGLGRIFNMKSFAEAGISLIKIFLIASIVYLVISSSLGDLIHDPAICNVDCKRQVMQSLVSKVVLFVLPLLLVLMVADYLVQRQHFMKEQRMTFEEVKREMKENEGDPFIKGARKSLAMELLADDMPDKVRQSRVVVMDGVIAIPLKYVPGDTPLPIILAIGRGEMARKIMEIASEEGIPVVKEVVLTQMLESEGKIDQFIPDVSIKRAARVIQGVPG